MLYINHLSKKEMDKKNNDGLLEDMPEKRKRTVQKPSYFGTVAR